MKTTRPRFALGALGLAAGDRLGLAPVVAATLLLGVSFAGIQLFPFSMVPDAIREAGPDELARTGSYLGVWTATEAIGSAAGPYVYAGALSLGGFVASRAGDQVTQSADAHSAILTGFTVVPAALMVLSLLLQLRYRLDARARSGGRAG